MSRYREKDSNDLAWNKTRRHITRSVDTVFADIREEVLNDLLSAAWDKYTKALEVGEIIQIEDEATLWLDDILQKKLKPLIEAEIGAVVESE